MDSNRFNRPVGEPTGPLSRGAVYTGMPKRMPAMCLNMRTSAAGKRFIFDVEVGGFKKHTAHLHWPQGKSGVTLGPGYDMRDRSVSGIMADLLAIGLDPLAASIAAQGHGLTRVAAEAFAKKHINVLSLTDEQQRALLALIIPRYEAIVNRHIGIHLWPHEFDDLVCFVYNPGDSFMPVAAKVNADDMIAAATVMRQRVPLEGTNRMGLITRRSRETALLLHATY